MHKFYYTYKITLLKGSLAGHYYYGQHQTYNLNDGYSGSGRKIKDYFKHYDKIEGVTYVKEILHFYNSIDELNEAEILLIGDKWKNDQLCLNLCGGGGNTTGIVFDEEQRKHISDGHKGISSGMKGKKPWNNGLHLSEEQKEKMRISLKGRKAPNKGKSHSEETKEKMRLAWKKRKENKNG